jgi:hypothetical protein
MLVIYLVHHRVGGGHFRYLDFIVKVRVLLTKFGHQELFEIFGEWNVTRLSRRYDVEDHDCMVRSMTMWCDEHEAPTPPKPSQPSCFTITSSSTFGHMQLCLIALTAIQRHLFRVLNRSYCQAYSSRCILLLSTCPLAQLENSDVPVS